ncbi:MAG: VirB4 family type IV secretion/conjugal transfer ATPase [Sphingomonadales bacterium]|nr:VirB4 family type IV secretion/conjugal transfer ATPase [Sphingomonadales bacterium]
MTTKNPDWQKERASATKLPFRAQINERTIALEGGRYMQTLRLDGLYFETADTQELNYRKELRAAILRSIGSSRFSIYQHIVRTRWHPEGEGRFPDPFSQALDQRWHGRLQAREIFQNHLFLTVVRRPSAGRRSFVANFLSDGLKNSEELLRFEVQALTEAVEALSASLAPYGPRVLRSYERDGATYSEPLEFLSLLFNGTEIPRQLDEGPLADQIAARRVSFGQQSVDLAPFAEDARQAQALISIKSYPNSTSPGILDDLLRLPMEFVATQSFSFVDQGTSSRRVGLALRRMRAADDEAVSLRGELTIAQDELAAGKAVFGEHHATIALRARNESELADGVAELQAVMADNGLIGVREDLGLEPAFWAQFPGNQAYIARKALISARNFASFASLHNFPTGQAVGNHWGDCVSLLETTAAGPYFFNFHQGDLGNFTIIGPSGSGKTVVLNFLLAQSMRFSPRLVFFDKDRGGEIFVRSIGGRYDVLRPGEPSGLNPLALERSPANKRFLIEWISLLIARNGPAPTPAELALIEDALEANFRAPPKLRRLRHFVDLLGGAEMPTETDLQARLRPWFGKGESAWLFDNEVDRLDDDATVLGFDMTRILDEPNLRTPAMFYLFHRVEERLDGRPTIIVIDEGWKALDDEVFVRRIRDWEKTIRKRNGLVGFVTQSAEDALASKISSSIVEQAATHMFMPNSRARAEDYVKGFGLSHHEFDIVRSLPDSSHCFLIKRGRESVVARLDLTGEKDVLNVLSGRESSVRRLDEIRARNGDSPDDWLEEFLEANR